MSAVLCIDAGNTLVKWCVQANWQQGFHAGCAVDSLPTERLKPLSACTNALAQALEARLIAPGLTAVLLCNVLGPAFESQLRELCSRFSLPLHVLSVKAYQPVRSLYLKPDTLGKDRWAAVLAVSSVSSHPVNLVVSFGTATTLDALVQQHGWQHLGGYIVPGVQTMLNSLHVNTAELPLGNLSRVLPPDAASAWPGSTEQAICEGVLHMQAGLVDASIRRLAQQFGQPPAVWFSGGFAPQVQAWLPQASLLQHGVFRGLLQDYQLYKRSSE